MAITKRPKTMKIELNLTDSHVIVIALKNRLTEPKQSKCLV